VHPNPDKEPMRMARRLVVEGDSMRPTLLAGDRVVAVGWGRVQVGDLVAVRDPREPARVLVKRVMGVDAAGLHLRGDDEDHSTDSRHFGPVARSLLLGRVVYRYAPPDRAGPLRRDGGAGRGS